MGICGFVCRLENYYNLQGSQTDAASHSAAQEFENYYNLQGSQTSICVVRSYTAFENYYNLQGSQTTGEMPMFNAYV